MRKLKTSEIKLIQTLLKSNQNLLAKFMLEIKNGLSVEDMNDGGMGSIRFLKDNKQERIWGETAVEKEFSDQDQIPVMIYLDLDTQGEFFELDIWKVDFSPVQNLVYEKVEKD